MLIKYTLSLHGTQTEFTKLPIKLNVSTSQMQLDFALLIKLETWR